MPSATPATAPPTQLFQYRARVTSVYDGDTCTAEIDLGLGVWVRGEKLRLHRINTPELHGADDAKGKAARDHLKTLVEGKDVLLQTIKDRREKYGRYLAEIWLEQPGAPTLNVNDAMVAAGHARYQDY
ncbi:MAG: thermonuclease family protein [Verrucomicrobia bacterium]|nr:thermonuclease family protein [Verrucomicrobiota bacterium]